MAALQSTEQLAQGGYRSPSAANCDSCRKPPVAAVASESVSARVETRQTLAIRISDANQVFAARLMSSVRAQVQVAASGYDNLESAVPQFLRGVAAELGAAPSPDAARAVLSQARATVDGAVAETRPLAQRQDEGAGRARQSLIGAARDGLARLRDAIGDGGVTQTVQAGFEQQVSTRFELQLRTRDGDLVSLRFFDQQTTSAFARGTVGGAAVSRELSLYTTTDQRLGVAISGHLDADELSAIEAVLAQADALARNVLAGDLEAAMQGMAAFAIDSSEIAGLALRMKFTERTDFSASRALASEAPAAPRPAAVPSESEPPAPAAVTPAATTPAPPLTVEPPAGTAESVKPTDTRADIASLLRDFIDRAHARNTAESAPPNVSALRTDAGFRLSLLQSLIQVRAAD